MEGKTGARGLISDYRFQVREPKTSYLGLETRVLPAAAAENFRGYANFAYTAPIHLIDQAMTLADFENTLTWKNPPKDIAPLLAALWHERQGDWKSAHNIAQDDHTQDGSWVHAYLHRVEGDQGNASYWYRRAGKPVPQVSADEEWRQLVTALLVKTK